MVAGHAFDGVSLRSQMTMAVMSVFVTMFMSTTTCRLMHQSHTKNIKKEQNEDTRAEPLKPACDIVTASMGIA